MPFTGKANACLRAKLIKGVRNSLAIKIISFIPENMGNFGKLGSFTLRPQIWYFLLPG
jgi:hypothetical protein